MCDPGPSSLASPGSLTELYIHKSHQPGTPTSESLGVEHGNFIKFFHEIPMHTGVCRPLTSLLSVTKPTLNV